MRWLPEHPDRTVAVLVPRNERGELVVNALKAQGIECVELLRSTRATREVAGALGNIVNCLADPASPKKLATAYAVWRRGERSDPAAWALVDATCRALRRCSQVEDFLWPRDDPESLAAIPPAAEDDDLADRLATFRSLVRRWQGAASLPIDQLLLTIAGDLGFSERPADLAVTHKLGVVLRQAAAAHPDWRLPELTQELAVIARNERKFLGFAAEDTGFDPDKHRGKVVVATIHKAKGLEWDRVYLMSANRYDFPSAQPGDTFIAEKWFIQGQLSLEAEALAQLQALAPLPEARGTGGGNTAAHPVWPQPGAATVQARLDYAAERLRLLYVGITRARRELIITTNTGRQPGASVQPAAPFIALATWWEERGREP
jgi:DNA helicase-2/ATP-dependent DNA helicase PcrA